MNNNIAIFFDYDEGWMIVLYQNGEQTKYWNCNEHDWEKAYEYINLLKKYEDVLEIHPKLKTYDEVSKYNIFDLTESDINELIGK